MKATHRSRELLGGILRAALVGAAGGCVALLFNAAMIAAQRAMFGASFEKVVLAGGNVLTQVRELPWWERLVIPGAGMLVGALALMYLAGVVAKGGGFADVMEGVSAKRGALAFWPTIGRALAAFAIVVTGNSVGREGLIIVVAAAAASALTRVLKFPVKDRGLLLGCGVAAGFAAAYNAPIAGAIFALELVLGNFAMELFAPVVVASVSAILVTRYAGGQTEAIYKVPQDFSFSLVEVFFYLVLGVFGGYAAVAFQTMLKRTTKFVRDLAAPRVVTMTAGGLAVGAIAISCPEIWGNGYQAVSEFLTKSGVRLESAVWPHLALWMLLLMVVKAVATAITVGSGGAGGVFTPSLFVGAALGGAFGAAVHEMFPNWTGDYSGYALVGMGCLVAGTTRAPIMAIMVMFEMTGHYDIVPPLMLGCVTSSLVARALYPNSLYTEELVERGSKTPQGLEETVLVTTRVEDVMRTQPTWVAQKATYAEIVPLVTASRATAVNVCGEEMRFLGVVRVHSMIELLAMGDIGPGIVAADLMSPVDPVTRDEPLSSVFEAFDMNDLDELPVVDSDEGLHLVGTVTRRDVMAALHMEVLKRQNLRAKFVRREDEQAQTDYVELPKGVELARVPAHPSHFGKSLGDTAIRKAYKLTVLSIVRLDEGGREIRILPDTDMKLAAGDQLIVIGTSEDIKRWRAEVGDG